MTSGEKRLDAAHMLGISATATPEMVDDAYMRRLGQFMDFKCASEMFSKKSLNLYDAHVRMSYPPHHQVRAEWKLLTTSQSYKLYHTGVAMFRHIQNSGYDTVTNIMTDRCIDLLGQIYTRTKILRGTLVYNLTGLGGMMIYDIASPDHGPMAGMAVYGSMIVSFIIMACAMSSCDKKHKEFSNILNGIPFCRVR